MKNLFLLFLCVLAISGCNRKRVFVKSTVSNDAVVFHLKESIEKSSYRDGLKNYYLNFLSVDKNNCQLITEECTVWRIVNSGLDDAYIGRVIEVNVPPVPDVISYGQKLDHFKESVSPKALEPNLEYSIWLNIIEIDENGEVKTNFDGGSRLKLDGSVLHE